MDVMLILVFGSLLGLGVATIVFFSIDWVRVRARRKKVQPLLGVVLPKEDKNA